MSDCAASVGNELYLLPEGSGLCAPGGPSLDVGE